MDLLDPPADAQHAVALEGEVFIWQARPGLVVERADGILTLPLAQCFSGFIASVLEPRKPCTFFADYALLRGYTREAREHMNDFVLAHAPEMGAVHFLITSKFVALGLSTFKEEIGNELFRAYSDRTSFLRSFDEARQKAA